MRRTRSGRVAAGRLRTSRAVRATGSVGWPIRVPTMHALVARGSGGCACVMALANQPARLRSGATAGQSTRKDIPAMVFPRQMRNNK